MYANAPPVWDDRNRLFPIHPATKRPHRSRSFTICSTHWVHRALPGSPASVSLCIQHCCHNRYATIYYETKSNNCMARKKGLGFCLIFGILLETEEASMSRSRILQLRIRIIGIVRKYLNLVPYWNNRQNNGSLTFTTSICLCFYIINGPNIAYSGSIRLVDVIPHISSVNSLKIPGHKKYTIPNTKDVGDVIFKTILV